MPLQSRPTKSSERKILVSVHGIVNFNLICCKRRGAELEGLSARSLALDKVSDFGVLASDSVVTHAQLQLWHLEFSGCFFLLLVLPYASV